VILLENSNEWNLSPAKEESLKKREKEKKERGKKEEKKKKKGVRIDKQKRWNFIWRSSMFQKEKRKKRGWNLQAIGRDSIERKKADHIFL
jgi:hypothetical protein